MSRAPKILFLIAAILALLGIVAHEVLGAPKVLDPLHQTGLPTDVVWLHHFSWHVGTVAVLGMIAMFILAAQRAENVLLAIVASAMATGFALLGIGLAFWGDPVLWTTPAPYAWIPVSLFGWLGVFTEKRSS